MAQVPSFFNGGYGSAGTQPARPLSGSTVQELISVPEELIEWLSSPQSTPTLLDVKRNSGCNYINIITEDGSMSLLIDAVTEESARTARKLLELQFKQRKLLASAEANKTNTLTKLYHAQGEMVSGSIVEFKVEEDLLGFVIGKKGANVQKVEKECQIKSININPNGRIVIVGSDKEEVNRARAMLEFKQEHLQISESQWDFISRQPRELLEAMKSTADLSICRLSPRSECCITVIGPESSVTCAKSLFPSHMDCIDKLNEIKSGEQEAWKELREFNRAYGHGGREDGRGGRGGGRGGGGGRGRGHFAEGEQERERVVVDGGGVGGRSGRRRPDPTSLPPPPPPPPPPYPPTTTMPSREVKIVREANEKKGKKKREGKGEAGEDAKVEEATTSLESLTLKDAMAKKKPLKKETRGEKEEEVPAATTAPVSLPTPDGATTEGKKKPAKKKPARKESTMEMEVNVAATTTTTPATLPPAASPADEDRIAEDGTKKKDRKNKKGANGGGDAAAADGIADGKGEGEKGRNKSTPLGEAPSAVGDVKEAGEKKSKRGRKGKSGTGTGVSAAEGGSGSGSGSAESGGAAAIPPAPAPAPSTSDSKGGNKKKQLEAKATMDPPATTTATAPLPESVKSTSSGNKRNAKGKKGSGDKDKGEEGGANNSPTKESGNV